MSSRIRKLLTKLTQSRPKITGVKIGRDTDLEFAAITAEGNNQIGNFTKISGELNIGFQTTIGLANYIFGGSVTIGRYCQLGPGVGIYAMNHPTDHLTMYLNNRLFSGRLKVHQEKGLVKIGNDVWVGHGAIILPNVCIGDGAVIGAGAVVTRDVEDYTIVAGNPARVLRKRFEESVIELLQDLRWWELPPPILAKIENLFHVNIVQEPEKAVALIKAFQKERTGLSTTTTTEMLTLNTNGTESN